MQTNDTWAIEDVAIGLPPTVHRIKEALDQLPPGRVLDSAGLSRRTGASYTNIGRPMRHPALQAYQVRINKRVYYGPPATLQSARLQNNTACPRTKTR